MKPGLAVVIITYNGAHKISNVLEELTKQTRPADEIVIVIDGSKDNTLEVVEKFKNRLPLIIVDIPNRGRSGARNLGVASCESELIVYLDDDTRPFKDCLKDHWEHYQLKPGSLLVGYILEDPKLFVTDIQQYRLTLYERMGWVRKNKGRVPMTEDDYFLAAANLSVSRTTFNKLNGFNVVIRDTEDFDFGRRAMVMGFEIYYMENYASAYHDELITCKTYINRQRLYIKSLQGIYALDPPLYEKYLKRLWVTTPLPKKFVYYFISSNF